MKDFARKMGTDQMNDRYLYRAKRTDNGEFIEGLLTIMWGQFHIIDPDDENTAYPIDQSTICQCTGLKDNNGKLEKQDVVTGSILWGSYIEIKSGLTLDDYVAFPYGKNVKEGTATVVSEDMQ